MIASVVFVFGRAVRRDPLYLWGISWVALAGFYGTLLLERVVPGTHSAAQVLSITGMTLSLWSAYALFSAPRPWERISFATSGRGSR